MRRLGATIAAAIAVMAIAVPAQADERGCDPHYHRDGKTIEVFCMGRPGTFRAVAHCHGGLTSWYQPGNVGRTNRWESRAECRSIIGSVWVDGYHIDWD